MPAHKKVTDMAGIVVANRKAHTKTGTGRHLGFAVAVVCVGLLLVAVPVSESHPAFLLLLGIIIACASVLVIAVSVFKTISDS
jgi:peptidoglycan/LPS O-acetylase OafA/YrhL